MIDGPTKGLRLLFSGGAPASGVQLDLSVGIGAKLFHAVDGMLDAVDGLFEGEIDSPSQQNTAAQERVDRMEERLEREREQLLERFAAMEAALTSMNRLLDGLKNQIESAFGPRR